MQFECFTIDDVANLKENPSEDTKLELIRKLHHNFGLEKLSPNEKTIAEEIIRCLAGDISVRIRQSIAVKFCDNVAIPHEVAVKLANDMEDIVAIPIIQNSSLLREADIINIIKKGSVTRQKAVASRENLTDNLCAYLIYEASPEAVEVLVNNKKAPLSENNCEILIRNHSKNNMIMRSMIANKKISLEQAHNLLSGVSEDLQKMLIVEYNIPSTVINNLVHDSKEWMILNLIIGHAEKHSSSLPLRHIIDKLHNDGELSFSILVKALSLGDLAFFEAALAKLANIPYENVHKLLWEKAGDAGFHALYQKCGLPESMSNAIYTFMNIVKEEKSMVDMQPKSVGKIQHTILNNLSRTANSNTVPNLDYLVTIVAYNLKKSNLL